MNAGKQLMNTSKDRKVPQKSLKDDAVPLQQLSEEEMIAYNNSLKKQCNSLENLIQTLKVITTICDALLDSQEDSQSNDESDRLTKPDTTK